MITYRDSFRWAFSFVRTLQITQCFIIIDTSKLNVNDMDYKMTKRDYIREIKHYLKENGLPKGGVHYFVPVIEIKQKVTFGGKTKVYETDIIGVSYSTIIYSTYIDGVKASYVSCNFSDKQCETQLLMNVFLRLRKDYENYVVY